MGNGGGLAGQLAARRAKAGGRTVLAVAGDRFSLQGDRATFSPSDPESVRQLLESVPRPGALLLLRGPGALGQGSATPDAETLLQLLHGLVAQPRSHPVRLWVVTAGSQAVVGGDRCDDPHGATLWGMALSASVEHAETWGGLIDLAADAAPEAAAGLVLREIEGSTVEDQVAFRSGKRLVARLDRRSPAPPTGGPFTARPDATYLVTGGLGGIGLAMAGWLVERGARHLALLGRTALPDRASWSTLDPASAAGRRASAVLALEARGALVEWPRSTSPSTATSSAASRAGAPAVSRRCAA